MTRRLKVIALAVVLIAAGLSGGCYAHQRPPALSTEEKAIASRGPLPHSVTVAWWGDEQRMSQNPAAYGEQLFKVLDASHAFTAVRYEPTAHPAASELVATSTGLYCNTAVIPLMTIISVGIIPTVFQDEQCQGMVLRGPAGAAPARALPFAVRYKGRVVMGWAALFLGLLPGWSYGSVGGDSRFTDRLRIAILRRQAQIDSMAKP